MRMLVPGERRGGSRQRGGFTLIELVAVALIITILVSLLCSALNHTKAKALRIGCLDNLKQLQIAWLMYASDNDDYLPLNRTGGPDHRRIMPRSTSAGSWVVGNPLLDLTTANLTRGTLYPYLRSTEVYRCPMDRSTVVQHADVLRTRSYSLNAYLGGDDPDLNPRVKEKYSQLVNPRGPVNIFAFVEEHESSVWGANFIVLPRERLAMASANWLSTPADRHQQGCNITFADGHAEHWRWHSPKNVNLENRLASSGREIADIRRLQSYLPGE